VRISRNIVLALAFAATIAGSQTPYPAFHSNNDFLFASPGAFKFGLYGYDNPAMTSLLQQPDLSFLWSDRTGTWKDFNRWGGFLAIPNAGFGVIHQKEGNLYVTDYRISVAGGNRTVSAGLGYGWSNGYTRTFNRSNLVYAGALIRPSSMVSLGLVGTFATQDRGVNEAVVDAAVRPFASSFWTLFADYAIQSKQSIADAHWSAGTAFELLPGICLTGRYFDSKSFTVGLQISFGRIGLATQAHYDTDQRYSHNTYGIRIGALDRTFLSGAKEAYLALDLRGPIKYQQFQLFDRSNTLLNLITTIDAAKEDPAVAGIAINTSAMAADKELLWEVREKLRDFKTSGKHVVVFVDQADINTYHLASVADKIVMDSQGLIQLTGFVMGRTYLKGTLEKIGIGYDEWRFFKYKSAVESLSRDSMSAADREQRQKLVDDYYTLATNDICAGRGITPGQFASMIDSGAVFLAGDALARGLVDTIGRWGTVEDVIKKIEGTSTRYVDAGALERMNRATDHRWSEPPTIAVIYALGACAMDEGITARRLVHDVETAVNSKSVKAIVLRVDSPGGDPMASDYIAEELKKAKGKKPIIVSQGAVAASGGYWLSMYADTIVAAPNTITGSIGVIGGWIYNKGIKEKLGMSTDLVKAGEHADLGFGFTLPLIGLGLPDRNLTATERSRMEYTIRSMYQDFVRRAAEGRKKHPDEIGLIAQGRVWSGYDGLKNGLVDKLGGIETAISIAKERAGIPTESEATILELPKPGLINFNQFLPKIVGIEARERDPLIEHLLFRLRHNGRGMMMLPVEEIDLQRIY
jgi:protease-4